MTQAGKVERKIGFAVSREPAASKSKSVPSGDTRAVERELSPRKTAAQPRAASTNRPLNPNRALGKEKTESNSTAASAEPSPPIMICREPVKRRKRVKVAEALREVALDEDWTAGKFLWLGNKLSGGAPEEKVGTAGDKLLLDLLKVVVLLLEPTRSPGGNSGADTPEFSHFTHNIPRPVRTE
jgi:hypothetical protein